MVTPIVKNVVVNCTAAHAYDVFVNQTARWWPLDKHAVSAMSGQPAQAVTIEPRIGGAVYETIADGSRSDWGQVTDIRPNEHITMTLHPGRSAENPTEVRLTFRAVDAGNTEVTLVQSQWDRLGADAAKSRDGYETGWVLVLDTCFVQGLCIGKCCVRMTLNVAAELLNQALVH